MIAGVSRRILIPFMAVVVVVIAELAWWVTFQVRQADQQAEERIARVYADQQLAVEHLALHTVVAGRISHPESIVQSAFPDLTWEIGPSHPHPILAEYYPNHHIVIRKEALARIDAQRRRHIRMFAAEGLVFLGMVVAGVLLLLRALRHEVALIKQQANFLSAVTHELKSPLASIRLYTETMQLRDVPKDKREHYLHAISDDVERLERLIANLLAAAHLESSDHEHESVSAKPMVMDIRDDVRAHLHKVALELAERGVRVAFEGSGAAQDDHVMPWRVAISADALHTILRNLLDNAVKYGVTPEHNQIHVALHRDAHGAILTVRDWGIGLQAHEDDKIFHKFYRVGDEMVRDKDGSGLGLYLVRGLVQAAGGDVKASSDGPGKGATFCVRLPWARDALHASKEKERA